MNLSDLESGLRDRTQKWDEHGKLSRPSQRVLWDDEQGLCVYVDTISTDPREGEFEKVCDQLDAEGKKYLTTWINSGHAIVDVIEPLVID